LPTFWAVIRFILFLTAIILFWLWMKYRKNTHALLSERDEIEDALIEVEEQQQQLQLEEMEQSAGDSQKYQKVKIDEAECANIVKRMRQYLEKDKVYTNADLKMKDLADELRLSPSKLSQVFNLYLNENYYEFINRYRLNEFKHLIETGEYKRYTITALSEKCGFKKSNFFSTFRKVEGMTPAEYLKKKGIKI
ncbi:MAG: AraC family transcriptional regulator, partial [Prevotella sp.]|nr:AraC family transcriptional regulator [Prevotella sp.]